MSIGFAVLHGSLVCPTRTHRPRCLKKSAAMGCMHTMHAMRRKKTQPDMTQAVNFSVQVLYTVDHRKQRSLASVCTGVDKGGPGGPAFPMAGQKKNLFVKIEGLSSFTWSVMWSQKEMEWQGRGAPPQFTFAATPLSVWVKVWNILQSSLQTCLGHRGILTTALLSILRVI